MSSYFPPNISNHNRSISHGLPLAFSLSRSPPLHICTAFRKQTAVQHLSETMEELYRSTLARLQLELALPDNVVKRLDAAIKERIVPPVTPDTALSVLNYGLDFEAVATSISRCAEFRYYFERTRSRNWETCFNNVLYYWAHAVCGVAEMYRRQTSTTRRSSESQVPGSSHYPESSIGSAPSTSPTSFASANPTDSPDDVFTAPPGCFSQLAGDLWMRLYPGQYAHYIEIRAISGAQEEVLSGHMQDLFHVRGPLGLKKNGYDHIAPHCRRFLEKKGIAPPGAEVELFYYVKMPNSPNPMRLTIWNNVTCAIAYDMWSSLEDDKIPFMLFLDDQKHSLSKLMLPHPKIPPSQPLEDTRRLSGGRFQLCGGY